MAPTHVKYAESTSASVRLNWVVIPCPKLRFLRSFTAVSSPSISHAFILDIELDGQMQRIVLNGRARHIERKLLAFGSNALSFGEPGEFVDASRPAVRLDAVERGLRQRRSRSPGKRIPIFRAY